MTKKLVTIVLLAVLSCSLTGNGFAKSKKKKPSSTQFDYYLLTLSWAPEFCATNPKGRSSAECDPKKHMGLVVHGLWPQYTTPRDGKDWPESCASTPPVASDTVDHMMPIMPGRDLIQHEWSKHGTCSGLAVQDYFAAIEKLYTDLKVPEDFKTPSDTEQTKPADIEGKFASANDAPKEAFRVSCPKNDFSAVEICLSKDLQYMACPADLKECRASKISVRPVP